jgi:hypothetical protein
MFARALAKNEGDPLAALEAYLLERGWPDDRRFETSFIEFSLYLRGYTKQVLEGLERARGHREPPDLTEAQVEHVLPQTLNDAWREVLGPQAVQVHAEWLHRPGNLTLSAYNQELWNHDFAIKRQRYAKSNISLTREIADSDRWGEAEIRARGQTLAREAAKIWVGPKVQIAPPVAEAGEEEAGPGRDELRRRFWTGLNDYLVAEHPDLPDLQTRPNWTIRLPSGIRHIGLELRFALRQGTVGIDVWFWREASFPLWEGIRASPAAYNGLVGCDWDFMQLEGRQRACMSIDRPTEDLRNESTWPQAYTWLGEKLSLVYERVVPGLREDLERVGRRGTPA